LNLAIQLTTPLLLRNPCKLFASVTRVCQRQLGFLVKSCRQLCFAPLWHKIASRTKKLLTQFFVCLQQSDSIATTSAMTFDGAALLTQSNQRTPSSAVSSSAELLARMRSQNSFLSSGSPSHNSDATDVEAVTANTDPQIAELLRDIRDFVACGCSVDGQATTKEILDHFRTRVPSELTAKFKALLKQVCTLQKVDGVGIWKLKHDFQ